MRQWLARTWSNLFSVSWQVLCLYRLIQFFRRKRGFKFLMVALAYFQQVLSGCHIHYTAKIGKDCHFPHPVGIVIGSYVQIGDHVKIFQHVTLGSHGRYGEEAGYPIVEDDVTIYTNSIIIGALTIGKGAVIGASSLVLSDVPAHGLVYGNPARLRGFICTCGEKLAKDSVPQSEAHDAVCLVCGKCGARYTVSGKALERFSKNT